jgi:hypothetical protein
VKYFTLVAAVSALPNGGAARITPIVELIAVRIWELAYAGEFDPEKLADTVAAEFDGLRTWRDADAAAFYRLTAGVGLEKQQCRWCWNKVGRVVASTLWRR